MIEKKHTLKQQKGNLAEKKAQLFLEKQGLVLADKNFRKLTGEIDLIMTEKNHLIFIEVRSRKKSTFGTAVDSISHQKKQKIIRTAELFLMQNKVWQTYPCRFDVVTFDQSDESAEKIEWIKNAFFL